jgi:hypothetical protein
VILVLLIVLAGLCGGGREKSGGSGGETTATSEPTTEEKAKQKTQEKAKQKKEAGNVAVRISGTPGLEYSGSYGNTQGQKTVDGTLGAQPAEYEVDADTGTFEFDVISASFQKRSPGPGSLLLEIVSEGDVQASQETQAEFGVVTSTWSPQAR